jgi:hypothetical protein
MEVEEISAIAYLYYRSKARYKRKYWIERGASLSVLLVWKPISGEFFRGL